jgi:hypothetical protein
MLTVYVAQPVVAPEVQLVSCVEGLQMYCPLEAPASPAATIGAVNTPASASR